MSVHDGTWTSCATVVLQPQRAAAPRRRLDKRCKKLRMLLSPTVKSWRSMSSTDRRNVLPTRSNMGAASTWVPSLVDRSYSYDVDESPLSSFASAGQICVAPLK